MVQEQKSAKLSAAEERIGAALIRIEKTAAQNAAKIAEGEIAIAEVARLTQKLSQAEAENAALILVRDQLKAQLAQGQALMGKGSDSLSSLKEDVQRLTNELAIKAEAVRAVTAENERLKRHRAETLESVDAIIDRVETMAEQVNG